MNKKIVKAEDLPENEKVYLKHSNAFGWKVVHPIRNEDGSMNWFNFFTGGSWMNWIFVLVIVLLILGAVYEYKLNIETFLDCFKSQQQLMLCQQLYG